MVYVLDTKQRRAFQSILSGLKFSRFGNKSIRFLTLTTSDIQANNIDYEAEKNLNLDFQVFYKRIKRSSPYKLYKQGYISENKLKSRYRNEGIFKNFDFEYFRVETNEGNGVLHILFRGQWLPYNYLVDNWQEIHNSWDLNIKFIDTADPKSSAGYVVSQYLSSQRSSYVRSSQSWNWVFRGFKKLWYQMATYYKKDLFNLWDNILKDRALKYFYQQKKLADFG